MRLNSPCSSTLSRSSRISARWFLAALLGLGLSTSCLYDGGPLEERLCEGPDQLCPEGFVCVDGYCADADAVDLPPEEDMVEEPEVDIPDEEVDPNSFCIDDDGDGFARADVDPRCPLQRELVDCDQDGNRKPDAAEVCDGVDNNCDGRVDGASELTDPEPCELQEGVCAGAMKVCNGGAYQPCGREQYNRAATDKGKIYLPDEAFCSRPTNNQPRLKANGECTTGAINPDVQSAANAEEILCDEADNDCDGVVDDPEDTQLPCYQGGVAADFPDRTLDHPTAFCVAGARVCVSGLYAQECAGEQAPLEETTGALRCDGIDQNCNGQANEACACQPGSQRDCYGGPQGTLGVGTCVGGRETCNEDGRGYGPCEGDVLPEAETCANATQDNDCNGEADDIGGATYGASCGRSGTEYSDILTGLPGVCMEGTLRCDARCTGPGDGGFCCVPNIAEGQNPETCDDRNVDNDCDGEPQDIDLNANTSREDLRVGGVCQTGQDGICAEGRWACPSTAGVDYPTCNPLYTPLAQDIGNTNAVLDDDRAVSTCNERDDDCDGNIDEDTDFTLEPNCGSCGTSCGSNETCCPPSLGAAPAQYQCTVYRSPGDPNQGDEDNCGGCGFDQANDPHRCGENQRCCDETCTDYLSDENNCGSCGNVCGNNQQCCGGSCINLSDAANCGACDNNCANQMNTVCCLPMAGPAIYQCRQQALCGN